MVKEMRKIMLGQDELVVALDSYRRTNANFLPSGKILGCRAGPDSTVNVGLEMAYGSATQNGNFTLKQSDLLEPIIRFCIENSIMLPRNSRKSASMVDDNGVLFIQIG